MSKNNNRVEHGAFFVMRTPRLALEHLKAFDSASADTNVILEKWLVIDGVLEAIYLASPSLLERIEQWRSKPESKQGKKVAQALLKYMLRMCARPTPFGLFSGIHMGKISECTEFKSASHSQDSRNTRLDMFYLSALKEHFVKEAQHADNLLYRPNPSHYFVADQCRYIENYLSEDSMQYRLSAVVSDENFQCVLNLAKSGSSFNGLVSAFCKKYSEAEKTDVEAYIQDLIDEKVLQADIPLPLTGDSPDHALLKSLQNMGELDTADKLATALNMIEKLDNDNKGDIDPYKQLLEHFQTLPVKAQENKLFQTDIYRAFDECQLSQQDVQRVEKQLELLAELGDREENNPLSGFVSKFNARFEGQFVPLDVILDDESGIGVSNETGYEAPLVAGLNLVKGNQGAGESPTPTQLTQIIEEALTLPINRAKDCIVLKSKELKGKVSNKEPISKKFPASFSAMLSAYHDDRGNPVYKLGGCSGPSSANLLGRFCHLNDDLKHSVIDELRKEQAHSNDVVFAEIAHMPEGRPGNVIARPHLRDHEIVFMADSSLASDQQLPLNDLFVWVEGQKVKLWSKRLNKQVIPRLSCAHNYSARSLSAYKFLCMLQHQDGQAPNFSMPNSTANAAFIPRIMLDNLILSEKTWRIDRKELEAINKNGQFSTDKLTVLLEKYHLDPQVSYAMADNVLQLDLRHPDMLNVLISETKGQTHVELKEVLTTQFTSRVTDANGHHYNNEMVIPFFNPNAEVHRHYTEEPLANITASPIKRRFSAGSEWLSLKIYSGNSIVEQLLTEKLMPFIAEQQAEFDKWFFIRYGDPDWHIRLRFYGEPSKLCGLLLPKLNQLLDPMVEAGELHKVELMTYEREVERYGGPDSMALVESLFMLDSELIARTCGLIDEYGEDIRWRVALQCTDKLLALFNYNDEARFNLISSLRAGFGNEFNETSQLRKQLGNRYRDYQTQLEDDFVKLADLGQLPEDEAQQAIAQLLTHWQQQAAPVVAKLNDMLESGKLNCSKDSLLNSLLHMHNNRMFKAYGREQELVIHDLMRRKYFSADKGQSN